MVWLWDRPLPTAVTTIGNVPTGTLGGAVSVKLAFPVPAGVIREVTPAGSPDTAKSMLANEPPPTGEAVKATDEEPPLCTCMTADDEDRLKSPGMALGLNWISRIGCSSITFGAAPC